jgi:hypothetical protein
MGFIAAPAAAAPRIGLAAETHLGDVIELTLTATNAGDETATRVVPEVGFHHESHRGPEVPSLPPGAEHRWVLALGPVPGPGTFPVTVVTRYWTADGTPGMALLVTLVATPGAPAAGVRGALSVPPLGQVEATTARLSLDNALPQRVAGRVAVLLPSALNSSPESQPAEVPANGSVEVPLVIERRQAEPAGPYPVFVLFEFEAAGVHHSVLTSAVLEAPEPATWTARVPLVVGSAALACALAVLAFALRRAAAQARGHRAADLGR